MKSINLRDNHGKTLDGPLLISDEVINDLRGYFVETWNSELFNKLVFDKINFKREFESCS